MIFHAFRWLIDRMIQDQEGNEEAFEEDDEDPVFVLTDEWREFFAKSEAKRRLGKLTALSSCLYCETLLLRVYILMAHSKEAG